MKSLNRRRCGWWTTWAITVGLAGIHSVAAAVSPIPIRNTLGDTNAAVGFQKDILPMFQANCLPCHNQTRAKAGLNLETPASLLRGAKPGRAQWPENPPRVSFSSPQPIRLKTWSCRRRATNPMPGI